jgi:PAS domain S-box-containing protein
LNFLEKHREELKASRDRLKESEARFRQMADNLPFLVWMVDAHGRMEFVNRTYCEYFGVSENEVLNDRWQVLVHPEEADAYLGEFFDSLREHRIFRSQTRVKNAAGAWRWVESVGRPRFSESGEFLGLVGASPDITESKQAEHALRSSEKRLQLLYETSALLLRVENPQQVIGDIARKVMEHLECQFFFNFLVDAESGRLKLNAWAGISAETANSIRILDYGVAVCGCVARDGQRIIVDNILDSQDPMTELIRGFGIQAYCCHPMMAKGKLLGTLSFGTSTRPQFDSYDVDLMQVVADQAGVAIERLWGRETMESMVQERTASLLAANRELELRSNQLRRLAGEMTMAEQRERKRLAQVLHDGLQQYLAAIKLQVGELSTGHEPVEAHHVEAMLSEAIQMSRSLSTELSPPILYERGLISALEWFSRTMRDQHGFTVNCRTRSEVELSEEWRVMLFQSARELLFNAAKHSGATSADVDVQVQDGTLWISISDSGCGFDPRLLVAGETEVNGFGIFSIRERLGLLGGFLKIESAPGCGSRFTMKVPFSPPAERGDTLQTPVFGKPIRVLLADDHALFRDGLDRLFRKNARHSGGWARRFRAGCDRSGRGAQAGCDPDGCRHARDERHQCDAGHLRESPRNSDHRPFDVRRGPERSTHAAGGRRRLRVQIIFGFRAAGRHPPQLLSHPLSDGLSSFRAALSDSGQARTSHAPPGLYPIWLFRRIRYPQAPAKTGVPRGERDCYLNEVNRLTRF